MPNAGDELHHFGWNACSSCLSPYAPHAHMERRYLVVPGIRSSRIHIIDTKPDPRHPKIVKVVEAETLAQRTGYSRPHTVHCGPDGVYGQRSRLNNRRGAGRPTWIRRLTWGNGNLTAALSTWRVSGGTWASNPDHEQTSTTFENGLIPEVLLSGHSLHVWDLPPAGSGKEYRLSSKFVRPMTRPKHTGLWAWSSR